MNALWKKALLCVGSLIAILGSACDPGFAELQSNVKTLDIVVTPSHASRQFVLTLDAHKNKNVEWELLKYIASIKYTFATRDKDNPKSANVEVSFARHPADQQASRGLCFVDPSVCKWKKENIDLQKGYEWKLGHELSSSEKDTRPLARRWIFYIEIKLKEGAPAKGKLELGCTLSIAKASPEDLNGTVLNWRVEERIKP